MAVVSKMFNLLILGGTREASQLAQQAVNDAHLRVITSLAGRTTQPAFIPGEVRSGGFGGEQGFIDYLRANSIGAVVNATHPFANEISRYAVTACQQENIPYLRFLRPAWQTQSGDQWYCVEDVASAARMVAKVGKRIFLACGRKEIKYFAGTDKDLFFLVRFIQSDSQKLPLNHYELIFDRGPFAETQELDVLKRYRIDLVVSKNSGGSGAYAKIAAARKLSIPIVMIQRPLQSQAVTVTQLAQVMTWINDRFCH